MLFLAAAIRAMSTKYRDIQYLKRFVYDFVKIRSRVLSNKHRRAQIMEKFTLENRIAAIMDHVTRCDYVRNLPNAPPTREQLERWFPLTPDIQCFYDYSLKSDKLLMILFRTEPTGTRGGEMIKRFTEHTTEKYNARAKEIGKLEQWT